MNKQLAFIVVAVLALFGLAGIVVLMILKPEAVDDLMDYLFQLLILLGGFGGLAAMQAQQGKEIETIKRNTNGTLTRKDDEIAALRSIAAEHAPRALAKHDTDTAQTGPIATS